MKKRKLEDIIPNIKGLDNKQIYKIVEELNEIIVDIKKLISTRNED